MARAVVREAQKRGIDHEERHSKNEENIINYHLSLRLLQASSLYVLDK